MCVCVCVCTYLRRDVHFLMSCTYMYVCMPMFFVKVMCVYACPGCIYMCVVRVCGVCLEYVHVCVCVQYCIIIQLVVSVMMYQTILCKILTTSAQS